MHKHGIPPINPLDFDPFIISDAMLGPAHSAEFHLPQTEPLFSLPPLQPPLHLNDTAVGMNGYRSMSNGVGTSSGSSGSQVAGLHLDLAVSPQGQPLPTRSFSRSLPDLGPPRCTIHEQPQSPKRPHSHALSNKEIVREQNRRAAARFRQRQKASDLDSLRV